MIQRIQSLILLLSALCSLIIIFYFPVLHVRIYNSDNYIFLTDTFSYPRLFIFLSVGLNIFSIFQFKNRNRQIIINQISKLFISIAFIIIIFQRGELNFAIGLLLFIIPYSLIILANYLIRKDEKLVKSADRIR
ncbi:MAG TPA: DUF4293 family protein [Flavobacteriales bacterium]|nr:DUF4293 family protein [Flavobacteriales bacterium]|tara:strand:+ start:98 stop:499 length:402 start_codon:yes stop_codon:yes gene_type:complete